MPKTKRGTRNATAPDRHEKAQRLWSLRVELREARAHDREYAAYHSKVKCMTTAQVRTAWWHATEPWQRFLIAVHVLRAVEPLRDEYDRWYESAREGKFLDMSKPLRAVCDALAFKSPKRSSPRIGGELISEAGREVSTPPGRMPSDELDHVRTARKLARYAEREALARSA